MADKTTALSIIIRAVDHATGGIAAISKRLDGITKPLKESGKAASELRDHLGLLGYDAVAGGIRGVGSAVSDIAGKVALVGGAAVAAVYGLKTLVDEFAGLGHTAKRAGVEVDFLAGLRYAAEKSGLSIEQLDSGLTSLTQNLGQMKAGTGRAFKFITEHVSGVFAQQLIGAHGTAEALGLVADALAKLPDAERRAALAQKLLGDNAFAPFLAKGSKGIQALMGAYAGLAGSQQGAVDGALSVEESMVDLRASTDGVKAAIVTGLSPALKIIVDQLKDWFVEHQGAIAEWASDIGAKLPAAIDKVITVVKAAVGDVQAFVDDIGGWKVAAEGLALVLEGRLIVAVASLSVALVETPFGTVLLGLTAIVAAVMKLTGATEDFESVAERLGFTPKKKKKKKMVDIGGGITVDAEWAERRDAMMEDGRRQAKAEAAAKAALDEDPAVQAARLQQDQQSALDVFPENSVAARARALNVKFFGEKATREAEDKARAQITVEFKNAPPGMRATVVSEDGAGVNLNVGYQVAVSP